MLPTSQGCSKPMQVSFWRAKLRPPGTVTMGACYAQGGQQDGAGGTVSSPGQGCACALSNGCGVLWTCSPGLCPASLLPPLLHAPVLCSKLPDKLLYLSRQVAQRTTKCQAVTPHWKLGVPISTCLILQSCVLCGGEALSPLSHPHPLGQLGCSCLGRGAMPRAGVACVQQEWGHLVGPRSSFCLSALSEQPGDWFSVGSPVELCWDPPPTLGESPGL